MAAIDEKCVFALAPADARGTVTLIVGLPTAAWEYMKDGKTHHFDLSRAGLPVQLILFGAETHDAAMKTLDEAMRARGAAYFDRRREDWSIKPKR